MPGTANQRDALSMKFSSLPTEGFALAEARFPPAGRGSCRQRGAEARGSLAPRPPPQFHPHTAPGPPPSAGTTWSHGARRGRRITPVIDENSPGGFGKGHPRLGTGTLPGAAACERPEAVAGSPCPGALRPEPPSGQGQGELQAERQRPPSRLPPAAPRYPVRARPAGGIPAPRRGASHPDLAADLGADLHGRGLPARLPPRPRQRRTAPGLRLRRPLAGRGPASAPPPLAPHGPAPRGRRAPGCAEPRAGGAPLASRLSSSPSSATARGSPAPPSCFVV